MTDFEFKTTLVSFFKRNGKRIFSIKDSLYVCKTIDFPFSINGNSQGFISAKETLALQGLEFDNIALLFMNHIKVLDHKKTAEMIENKLQDFVRNKESVDMRFSPNIELYVYE